VPGSPGDARAHTQRRLPADSNFRVSLALSLIRPVCLGANRSSFHGAHVVDALSTRPAAGMIFCPLAFDRPESSFGNPRRKCVVLTWRP
jgi:hypothetical protein